MRLQTFIITAIGLFFILSLAGISTTSNNIFNTFELNSTQNATIETNPSVGDLGDLASIKALVFDKPYWVIVGLALLGITVLSLIRISTFIISIQVDITAIYSIIGFVLWVVIALDLISLLGYLHGLTGGTGWMYNVSNLLIIVYLVSYSLALLKFVRTGE